MPNDLEGRSCPDCGTEMAQIGDKLICAECPGLPRARQITHTVYAVASACEEAGHHVPCCDRLTEHITAFAHDLIRECAGVACTCSPFRPYVGHDEGCKTLRCLRHFNLTGDDNAER